MSHRILYQPSGPQVVASWLSSTLSRTSSENCASLLLMTPDARYAGWIQEALSRSASTALVGGMVCAIGHRQGIQRPGMSLSTFSNDKNTRCVPFYVPPDLLRSATKAVGRWPEQRRSTAMGDLWPSGFDLSNGSFSTTEETDATHAALQLQISITEQVGFPSPKLLLLLAGAQEAPAALRLLDTCFPWANKMGLIASHTPFVTGSPHLLLILNKAREESLSLLPGGLVGLAFDGNLKERPLEIRHPALKPLGDPLQITKARGNMILGLEDAPATKELLKRLSDPKAPEVVKKDSASLYVSISVGSPDPKSCNVFRITGGEPSKGVLALNTDRELEPGMWLQFYAPVGAEAQHEIGSGGSLSFSKTSDLLRTFPTEADDIISDATSLHVMSSSGIISGQPRLSGLSDWAPTLVHDDPDASVCLPQ